MFEDQHVDLLPERTTMATVINWGNIIGVGGTAVSVAVAINAGNITFGSGSPTYQAIAIAQSYGGGGVIVGP